MAYVYVSLKYFIHFRNLPQTSTKSTTTLVYQQQVIYFGEHSISLKGTYTLRRMETFNALQKERASSGKVL